MPVTPKFQIDQNSTHITINIRAQYARLESAEAYVDEKSFLFSASPYFLRLYFEEKLVTDDDPRCKYDSDQNIYSFEVKKLEEGTEFKNLNSIGSLLASNQNSEFKGIEVVGGDNEIENESDENS